ncbi:MAG TPA: hypothetical protein VHV83_10930, partial [Armatimonadota bacterium]|nr:hypothetical protein [Armatimonadota bacterium]
YAAVAFDGYHPGQTGAGLLRYTFGNKYLEIGYGCDLATVELPPISDTDDEYPYYDTADESDDDTGLGDLFGEILIAGVKYLTYDSFKYADNRQINAQVRLYPLPHGDGLALGWRHGESINDWSDRDSYSTNQLYLAATKTMSTVTPIVRGTAGVSWTQRHTFSDDVSGLRPYLSGEVYFSKRLSLSADYQLPCHHFDQQPLYSLVVRAKASRNINFDLGISNIASDGVSGTGQQSIFTGMALTLD